MGPVNVVIPLQYKNSYYDNFELRHCLRSIEANLGGRGEIIIVGYYPTWIKNVRHIPFKDGSRKNFNIFAKLAAGSAFGDFLGWSDDTYLTAPIEAREIPAYYCGSLEDWALKLDVNSQYKIVIRNTWELFPGGKFYNVHTPGLYDSAKFQDLLKMDWARKEYLTKSSYYNTFPPEEPVLLKDPKVMDHIPEGAFFSTVARISAPVMSQIMKLWPSKSYFEK